MFKRMLLIVCSGMLLFGGTELLYSEQVEKDATTGATVAQKVEVGNKICPVSGEKVGQGGMEPARYEYEGKIYNFCCSACVDEFKKDPEKYIKITEAEKQAEVEKTPQSSSHMH